MYVRTYVRIYVYMYLYLRTVWAFSDMKRMCWTTGNWRSCLSLEVDSSIPAGSMIIHRFHCGLICVYLCQIINIKLPNMYIATAGAQFKINIHRCQHWHMCIPDGLSVVQCSLGHVLGVVFLTQFQWHEANVLGNWQLADLPQSGGREFDPHRVHDNLSVPLFSCARASKLNQQICTYIRIYVCLYTCIYIYVQTYVYLPA